MGRLFAYGYPSDTFVKLPVSQTKHLFFYAVDMNKPLNSFGFTGLGERCCVYQWAKSGSLLVNWPPAIPLPPWTFSQQWNQPGAYLCQPV